MLANLSNDGDFFQKLCDWLERVVEGSSSSREILFETTATRQVTIKPLINTTVLYTELFTSMPSMPLARFEPMRQRYVASREANRLTTEPCISSNNSFFYLIVKESFEYGQL